MTVLSSLVVVGLSLVVSSKTQGKEIDNNNNDDKMLLTPIGYWPSKCIHGVSSGSHIINLNDTAFMIKDLNNPDKNIIKTRCDKSYLHSMKSKHKRKQDLKKRINKKLHKLNGNKNKNKNGNNKVVDGDGWQQYTKQESGDTTTGLLGYWTVPEEPEKSGGTLFTFTGLQNIDWVPPSPEPSEDFDIIQPVLQYGESAAGGGAYWSIASWYVTLGLDVVYSTLQEVKAGVSLFGNMTKTGDEEWYIAAIDQSTNVNSDITVSKSRLETQPWSYVTLEVYDVFECSQFPTIGTPIPYTQLKLYLNGEETDPTWEIGTDGQNPPICNSTITINDENTVTITF